MSCSPINKQSGSKTNFRMDRQNKIPKVKNLNRIPPSYCHTIPVDVLGELAARFLINIPLEEREDLIRVCFQVELAHWFYIDFYLPNNNSLIECSIKEFAAHMFHHVPFLQKYKDDVDEVVETWCEYKLSVPVNGAIILNATMDKVLMVQGFNKRGGWAFPKGKVNECEEPYDCAAREVLEETGFDVGDLIQKNLYLEQVVNNQTVRLYLVPGVAETTDFYPRSRGEISNVQWWDLAYLPIRVGDKTTKDRLGLSPHMFYNVIPFVKSIRKWVAKQTLPHYRHVPAKAREAVIERELKNSAFDEHKTVHPVVSDTFCPISWQNFKLNLVHIEHKKMTDDPQFNEGANTNFREFINQKMTDPQSERANNSLREFINLKKTAPQSEKANTSLKELINLKKTAPQSEKANTSLKEFIYIEHKKMTDDPQFNEGATTNLKEFINWKKTDPQSEKANTSLKELINLKKTDLQSAKANISLKEFIKRKKTEPQSDLESSTSWKEFISQITNQAKTISGQSSSCSL